MTGFETVRPPRADELGRLPDLERAAGELFRTAGMDFVADDEPFPLDELEAYRSGGRAWEQGFTVLDRPGPELVEVRRRETEHGLDRRPRICMWRQL